VRAARSDPVTVGYLTLGQIADRTTMLEVACAKCDRRGRYNTASLLRQFGREKPGPEWLREISADCPRQQDPDARSYELCGVHSPGLARLFLPQGQ
jgi:hypothetical protein